VFSPEDGLKELGLDLPEAGYPAEEPYDAAHARTPRAIDFFADELRARNEALQANDTAPLSDPEFYGARLYTGPMYSKYNLVLRGSPDNALAKFHADFKMLCRGNKYATTLHTSARRYTFEAPAMLMT
jgi:hypothetical protein